MQTSEGFNSKDHADTTGEPWAFPDPPWEEMPRGFPRALGGPAHLYETRRLLRFWHFGGNKSPAADFHDR